MVKYFFSALIIGLSLGSLAAPKSVPKKSGVGSTNASETKATPNNSPVNSSGNSSGNLSVESDKKGITFIVDSASSVVTLRLSHSLMGRFDEPGKGALSGKIEVNKEAVRAAKLDFKVDSILSLIGLRDEHMKRDYLESAKFPLVSLIDFEGTLSTKDSPSEKPFSAKLIVKGKTAPVAGVAKVQILDNQILKVKAEFKTKISDFPIEKPNYKGLGVDDELTVLAEFSARPEIVE